MFSCCRANPKAAKKDKDKHKKSDEGNNDDEETNEINETAAPAAESAIAELKPSETEKETQTDTATDTETEVKPNGNLTAKSAESPIETEDREERSEEQIDQTGIHNKQQYIYSLRNS